MNTFVRHVIRLAYHAGALGLLGIGFLDSSPLVFPLGNDLLFIGLSARHHDKVPLYVLAATAGSLLGVLLILWLSKKGREHVHESSGGRKSKYVEKQISDHIGWALILASLMPPPFPFTLFIAAAGAVKAPLARVMAYVAAGRLVRFSIEAALAIRYGRWILSLAESPVFEGFVIAILVVAIAGSAYTIYRWAKHR